MDEFVSVLAEIAKESERSIALTLTAWLDDALAHLLRSRFVGEVAIADGLLASGDAPLGTFSARINLCHALGLMPKTIWRDLHTIRDIRNEFAHFRKHLTFKDASLRDKCDNLHTKKQVVKLVGWKSKEPRDHFVFTAILLTLHFITLKANLPPPQVVVSVPPEVEEYAPWGDPKRLHEFVEVLHKHHPTGPEGQYTSVATTG